MSQITNSSTSGSSPFFTVPYTSVTTTPYVVLPTDYYLGVSSTIADSPVTIQLPDAPATGRLFIVKDTTGEAGLGFPDTITTVSGTVLIDELTTFVLSTNFQSASFIFNGTSYEVF